MALNPRTELLFPPRLIPGLARLRGDEWRELVEYVASLPETHPDTLAFCLMMIRLNACLGCVSGSYRFMRGCELCSHQTVARFQGTDVELLELYERARQDLERAEKDHIDLVADAPDPETEENE